MSAGEQGQRMIAALEQVTVRYGKTLAADRVSLEVKPGTVYALLGRNGAGKSSLVRCLLGQRKPDHGVARLFGADVWRSRAHAMARVGVVPEESDLPREMTALALEKFCRPLYPCWNSDDFLRRLRRFDVPLNRPVRTLSKGQAGQLTLALALAPRPELLVLDDPTLGLDAVARNEFWEELVGDLADRGTTVFITTHDLEGVEGIAQQIGFLKEGRLVLDEELEALRARFRIIRWGGGDAEASSSNGELKAWEPLQINRSALGIEAIVAGWRQDAETALRRQPPWADAEIRPLTLTEIFSAVVAAPREDCR